MIVIGAENVSDALWRGLDLFRKGEHTRTVQSRNGPTIEAIAPVTTVYRYPLQRVLFCPVRDANPFFHIIEAAWMLAGRNDLRTLANILPHFAQYSDDGRTLYGAYGARLMHQLRTVATRLIADPNTRRAVATIIEPRDIDYNGKDMPCNNLLYFTLRDGVLDMTVTCRSNDMVWGAYGANAVHFSYFQEYVAALVGCSVGIYTQISNNFHIYPEVPVVQRLLERGTALDTHYANDRVHFPLMQHAPTFDEELNSFFDMAYPDYQVWSEPWIDGVLAPAFSAHRLYRIGDTHYALSEANDIQDTAWRKACVEWLERRIAKTKGVAHA